MRTLLRSLLLIAVVLAVPIVPFALFGESMESRIEAWLEATVAPEAVAAMVVGLLATDIFLPVPSSVLSTFAGKALGFWGATASSWLGMTAGAAFAFWLARALGRPLAERLAGNGELRRIDHMAGRFGPLVLVIARPLPVLAEASVLLFGTTQLTWRRFFLPVALSNLGIAAAYAALGNVVHLPVALAASIAVPVAALAVARLAWPTEQASKAETGVAEEEENRTMGEPKNTRNNS